MNELDAVIDRMDALREENGIPSNVKNALNQSINALQNDEDELSVRINTATSLLDEVSNDPNIAQHTRTEVWNIASMLESVDTDR